MFLEWGRIPSEEAFGVGAKTGMRTGLIASSIGATATFLVAALGAGGFSAGMANSSGEAIGAGASLIGMNLLVAAVSLIPGTLFGTVGGVIGAAIKKK